nr:hypothetical protein [Sicyoidochytrium minutum DNA virus]
MRVFTLTESNERLLYAASSLVAVGIVIAYALWDNYLAVSVIASVFLLVITLIYILESKRAIVSGWRLLVMYGTIVAVIGADVYVWAFGPRPLNVSNPSLDIQSPAPWASLVGLISLFVVTVVKPPSIKIPAESEFYSRTANLQQALERALISLCLPSKENDQMLEGLKAFTQAGSLIGSDVNGKTWGMDIWPKEGFTLSMVPESTQESRLEHRLATTELVSTVVTRRAAQVALRGLSQLMTKDEIRSYAHSRGLSDAEADNIADVLGVLPRSIPDHDVLIRGLTTIGTDLPYPSGFDFKTSLLGQGVEEETADYMTEEYNALPSGPGVQATRLRRKEYVEIFSSRNLSHLLVLPSSILTEKRSFFLDRLKNIEIATKKQMYAATARFRKSLRLFDILGDQKSYDKEKAVYLNRLKSLRQEYDSRVKVILEAFENESRDAFMKVIDGVKKEIGHLEGFESDPDLRFKAAKVLRDAFMGIVDVSLNRISVMGNQEADIRYACLEYQSQLDIVDSYIEDVLTQANQLLKDMDRAKADYDELKGGPKDFAGEQYVALKYELSRLFSAFGCLESDLETAARGKNISERWSILGERNKAHARELMMLQSSPLSPILKISKSARYITNIVKINRLLRWKEDEIPVKSLAERYCLSEAQASSFKSFLDMMRAKFEKKVPVPVEEADRIREWPIDVGLRKDIDDKKQKERDANRRRVSSVKIHHEHRHRLRHKKGRKEKLD